MQFQTTSDLPSSSYDMLTLWQLRWNHWPQLSHTTPLSSQDTDRSQVPQLCGEDGSNDGSSFGGVELVGVGSMVLVVGPGFGSGAYD